MVREKEEYAVLGEQMNTEARAYKAMTLEQQSGIWYRDVRYPSNTARGLPDFHTPSGLLDLLKRSKAAAEMKLQQLAEVNNLLGTERYPIVSTHQDELLGNDGYSEANLKTAWRNKTNQDIAASIIGHIRRAALGEALISFEQRVTTAMQRVYAQRQWIPVQRQWFD